MLQYLTHSDVILHRFRNVIKMVRIYPSKDILPEYLELFFKTATFSSEVGKRLEGSVRLCLSFEGLCEIVIPIISIREQRSLVEKTTAFYSKLDIEKGFLRSYQSQKQYLLSQMFI